MDRTREKRNPLSLRCDHFHFVSDGPNLVCAKCTLKYASLSDEDLGHGLTLDVQGVNSIEELVNPSMFDRIVGGIAAVGPFERRDVHVFNMQIQGNGNGANVSFVVRGPFYSGGYVR